MGVGDVLSNIGQGLAGVGKAAGRAVQEFGPEIGTAIRGDAGQVAYEQRQHQYSQEEQEREIRANSLEQEIEIMRNVGPQQGQDPAQWEQAIAGKVRDLTGIYPKAQHAPQLMDRLKRIAHGKQGQQQPMSEQVPGVPGLTSTGYLPPQGLWQAQAEMKAAARPKTTNPKVDFLNRIATEQGVPTFADLDSEGQAAALTEYAKASTKAAVENITTEALNKFTEDNYHKAYKDASSAEQLAAIQGVASAHVVQRETRRTTTDALGDTSTSVSTTGPAAIGQVLPPVAKKPAATAPTPTRKAALTSLTGGSGDLPKLEEAIKNHDITLDEVRRVYGKTTAKKLAEDMESKGLPLGAGPKLSAQDARLTTLVKQIDPKIANLKKVIEDAGLQQDNSFVFSEHSALSNWLRFHGQYKRGVAPDKLSGDLIKSAAALQVMGAAPWMTLSRGKYMFETIVQHLPDPIDTPAQLYQKMEFLQGIMDEAKGALPPNAFPEQGGSQQGGEDTTKQEILNMMNQLDKQKSNAPTKP